MLGLKFEGNTKLRVSRWGTLCGVFAMLVFVTGCPWPTVTPCTEDADCDDGLFCNGVETCVEEVCAAGEAPCDADHCDEDADLCYECIADDECDDADLCTTDTCVENACVYTPVDCGDEFCDPATGACVECLVDADCDDGEYCTGEETCVGNACVAGTDPCDPATEVCNEDTDSCDTLCVEDADCADDDLCNGTETCSAEGVCQPGTPLNCDDEDLCTTDTCDAATGCVYTPVECAVGFECDPETGECVEIVAETFTLTADASATQAEGDSGTTNFTFTVTRAGGTAAHTVDYAVTGGTGTTDAAADDFTGGAFPSGTVAYAIAENGDKTITIGVAGDTDVEQDEIFTVTLTDPDDGDAVLGTATGTIQNDDSSANPEFTLPTGAGATVGQNSLITGISVSDADNSTLTVDIVTSDGFLSFSAAPACTAVDGAGNAVTLANVLKDEYVLTGTITNINQTLSGFQFTTDRSSNNPGTDQVEFMATDADGGTGSGTLNIAVGIRMTLTAASDSGADFTGTPGGDVFYSGAGTPGNFGQGDVLIGGDGPDMIQINQAAAATYPNTDTAAFSATGIETLFVDSTAGAPTFNNFQDMPALSTFIYAPSAAHALTIDEAPDQFLLQIDTRNGAFAAAVDVDIKDATFGSQAFTVEMLGDATNGCDITTLDNGNGDVESVTLVSGSRNGTTVTGNQLSTGAGGSIALTTLFIEGDQNLNIGVWGATTVANIDASAFTGILTTGAYAQASGSLLGGSGNDVLVGGANAQAINGGPGNDTITGGAGADQYTGGPGSDIFRFAESAAINTITAADFVPGTDDLSISEGNTFGGGAAGFARGTGAAGTVTATAAGSTIIQSVAQNAAATAIGATTDFIKLTTGVAAGATAQLTFDAAIGTATLTGLTANTFHVGSYYDTTNSRMVVFEANPGAADTTLGATDTITEFVRIPMTAAEYAAFDTNDLSFY